MLRLDPAYPPVWRSPTVLQFGVDGVVRVDEPTPWQEKLVKALERGVPETALRWTAVSVGAPADDAAAFVERLAPVLEGGHARTLTPQAVVHLPDGFDRETADRLLAALAAAGVMPMVAEGPTLTRMAPEPVVLVAQHVVEPRRARALMADDRVHLPVVFTGDRVTVGPLVRPGMTCCLACIDRERQEADPAWPWILAQLVERPPLPAQPALAAEAGLLAARALTAEPSSIDWSVEAHAAHPRRRWHAHRPRKDCGCRSLAESATAPAPALRPSEPMTA